MQVVMSGDGAFSGEEENINLVILIGGLGLALRMGMWEIIHELLRLIQRYRAVRLMAFNPHIDPENIPDAYFVFRSEELHRAWLLLHADAALARIFPAESLIRDYWLNIPDGLWFRLTQNFHDAFCLELDDFNSRSSHFPANRWPQESLRTFREAHIDILTEYARRQTLARQSRN